MRARAEYATAKIAVWWDMKDCPIPDWYDASQIRQRLEGAFMERGYSGPVSITAYGDQTKTCDFNLKGLFYTGVSLAHTRTDELQGGMASSCNFDCRNVNKFKKHLSSYKHLRQEYVNPTCDEVIRVTESWGMNYKATPEYATAKIQVWWDMIACPLPQGYDARRVRPSLEAAFKELGYSGPVSITAYADHNHTPLQALSSTGVDAVHVVPYFTGVSSDVRKWHDKNPPQAAAIMMIISNHVHLYEDLLVDLLQENNYNLFVAYSFRPTKMSFLLTSAEWLWDRLLSVSEKSAQFLQKCSESESGEPRAMFYCKFCSFATKSIDNFRTHLSTDEAHAQEEKRIPAYHYSTIESHRLARVTQYRRDHCRETKRYRKSKRMKKAIRTGFGLLHNQLLLTNQR
ncbi:zinc finger protein-related [Raphanus sativus]|nr:zinc finger protein-related [Raphanus sativus]